ncbi:MAG TPA: alpha-glucan family phosphorylase [Candidatus Hydrogenedentes bacterium]|nr:alpha-glucan family phosphorylase [Candidatus Hydrogenedentota bacterium]HPG67496.1 alpha-glucan family phosphorylase [Candidatus Hydrogenedentota bacterium]
MPKITTFTVVPRLPTELKALAEISDNLWWCWDPEAIELFVRLDRDLWVQSNQNPKRVLGEISQKRLERLARDESFLAHLERVHGRLSKYLRGGKWLENNPDAPEGFCVAYLSAEFGLLESISIYSGGLGILAGDYLKAASDAGMPLVGIGLLYREGYFQQYLNADGWQQERYPENVFHDMPIALVRDDANQPMIVPVDYPGRVVQARVWKCMVGRVPLYLLDTDFETNAEEDREITGQLYGGDRDMRIRQEILLGMGGIRALRALKIQPTVYHMNEGHSAFMALERIRDLMSREPLNFDQAADAVRAGSVFTTHTPVPAGNDMFEPAMVQRYFADYCARVGLSLDRLLALGRQDPHDAHEPFCMTVLALRFSVASNGVSALHGEVAREMWHRTWPGLPRHEVPITSVTNGVHLPFWISRDLAGLHDRYLGPAWVANPSDQATWNRIEEIPDAELWRTHERRRERLVNFARRRLVKQLYNRAAPDAEIEAAREALDPEALTIGFARRFATYKRSYLLLMDPERLMRILTNKERPVQILMAGKAHPADTQGKDLVRKVIHFARQPEARGHIVFIEDYDINVARYMVQGVDCWLNTPRRPFEASGTSGMKAAANGALNISIQDGWWCEAVLLGKNGWSIGKGESYTDPTEQDIVESQALYEILETEVVPMFYDRTHGGVPRDWIARMKTAIRTICPVFNSNRMLHEYATRFYVPFSCRRRDLRADGRVRSVALTAWKQQIQRCWDQVRFVNVESGPTEGLEYGSHLKVTADLFLGELTSEDVRVELYHGDVDRRQQIVEGRAQAIPCVGHLENNVYRFEGELMCDKTGRRGFQARVIPENADLSGPFECGLVTWA